ncbi:hypothetical protein [Dyella sp. GSA-30]|jgi:hypothetical protein|uniref:hypothetical protein n=1 Tax=Dyella sp. GSA-30 TaxID=2994496 RepID=UPI00249247DB|nr:hypothetical protein [Dyella sp. GSA-30]BDU22235.1 hypothetical protein DYGSA30_36920 [Dyella sp. GSA-30]
MALKSFPTYEQFKAVLSQGGKVTFEIEATDIADDRGFETAASIKPHLDSGFSLRPNTLILAEPRAAAEMYLYGGEWLPVATSVYLKDGSITYRRLSPDVYEAVCVVPPPPTE